MSSGTVAIWAMNDGDYEPTEFAGTQAGLQSALDYAGIRGEVFIGPGILEITNLTVYGKCQVRGSGMFSTILRRNSAATGDAIREKTGAEGNPSGGVGLILTDFTLDGNGSSGGGLNLGNQGGSVFTSGARLADLYVYNFTSGTGITLLSNAIHCRNVWSLFNTVGFDLTGAANHFDGFWGEGNSTAQLIQRGAHNTFTHLQLEDNGVVATNQIDLKANASSNRFFGLFMSLSGNGTQLVINRTGAHHNCFYGVSVASNGHTYTNTIYSEAFTTGTGQDDFIAYYIDNTSASSAFYYNQSNGEMSTIDGARFAPKQVDIAGPLSVSTTSQFTGNITAGVAGTGYLATIGQGGVDASSSTIRLRSGTTGESVIYFNQNGTDFARLFMTASQTLLDSRGTFTIRNGIGGATMSAITTAGNLSCAGSMTVGNLTSGKYPKISTSGLLIDGPTPLAGTKVYYVSDSSGGAVTRKLTFTDGILTAET